MVLLVALPQNAGRRRKNLKERKMQKSAIEIRGIPAAVWGNRSEKVYIYAHGQGGSKDDAELLASVVCEQDRQVISFDLPGHGQRGREPASCDPQRAILEFREILSYANNTSHIFRKKKSHFLPLSEK